MLDYYARRAAEYDATSYEAIGGTDVADLERLVAFVSDLPPGRSLDVACGTGYLTRFLHGDVVALDQSSEMIAIARSRLPHAELVRAEVPPLPFAGDVFDRVFKLSVPDVCAVDSDWPRERLRHGRRGPCRGARWRR